jgi:Ubiquitin interaction motif
MPETSNNVVVGTEYADGTYVPRRSQRVATDLAPSDGDIWEEKLAVCEGVSPEGQPRLIIRSFYRNGRSKERVWDEPPSGAGTVIHATSEMRKTAELEREELRLTLDMIPPDSVELEEEDKEAPTKHGGEKKEKKGFFGRFRKKKEQKHVETAKDLNLQRAIAQSMADQAFGGGDSRAANGGIEVSTMDIVAEEEDLALAQALSVSLSIAETEAIRDTISEEEMFQRALERSRNDALKSTATGVAYLPNPFEDSFSSFLMPPETNLGDERDLDESDRKLPAIPSGSKPPASIGMKFDPYGK